jgi:beta-glucosidase
VAQTLAGVNNPAGRLPVTFYRGVDQLPPFEDYAMKNRTYRYFEGEPLFPFGFGLSYSMLTDDHLKLSNPELDPGNSLQVEAEVSDTDQRDREEAVELYLTFPNLPGAPLRARGFKRIHVAAGAPTGRF